jgi:putative hydrolase of the HAD superfamily
VVTHVLLDADGVLQRHPQPVVDLVRRVAGSGASERLAAGGRLARALHERVWLTIAPDDAVLALVRELRAGGVRVHLATNQRRARATYMRDVLGYGDHFDETFYSADLGAEKPDPAYFRAVVELLGVEPGECLLVDDRAPNVRAAREVGLLAEQWTTRDGMPALRAALVRHGVLR